MMTFCLGFEGVKMSLRGEEPSNSRVAYLLHIIEVLYQLIDSHFNLKENKIWHSRR